MRFTRYSQGSIWPQGYQLSARWFDEIIIDATYWYFFKGQGVLRDLESGATYPLHAGVGLFLRPGVKVVAEQKGSDGLGNLYFHFDLLEGGCLLEPAQWPELPLWQEVPDPGYYEASFRYLLSLLKRADLTGYGGCREARTAAGQFFKGLLCDLLHHHEQPRLQNTEWHRQWAVEATLRALKEETGFFPGVEALASVSGYSPSHFRALCRKITGKSPRSHLIEARIQQAKELLVHTPMSIAQIADHLRYENSYYFSRQFRQVTGMTASAFRQRGKMRD